MVQVAYPLEFPLDEIEECIRIVASKAILEEKALFAAAGWNILGYGIKIGVGVPGGLPLAVTLTAKGLGDLQRLRSSLMTVDPAGDAPMALPEWLVILIKALLAILSELGG